MSGDISLSLSGCSGPIAYCVNTHKQRERAWCVASLLSFFGPLSYYAKAVRCCSLSTVCLSVWWLWSSAHKSVQKGDAPVTLSLAEDGQGRRWLLSSLQSASGRGMRMCPAWAEQGGSLSKHCSCSFANFANGSAHSLTIQPQRSVCVVQ